jgi:acyl dehydratase
MNEEMYFEDFYPGQKFNSLRNYRVTAREIISFGESYDPQPFHIDEGAGENSFFSGLCASGWLTAAIGEGWHDRRRRRRNALDSSRAS